MKNSKTTLSHAMSLLTKKAVEKTVIKSANSTSSFWAHQPSAPKEIDRFKKN